MHKKASSIRACIAVATMSALVSVVGVSSASASATPDVANGSPAAITSFPFVVGLFFSAAGTGSQYCQGVIVDATHVITDANCLYDNETSQPYPPSTIEVLAGTDDLFGSGVDDPASQT